MSSSLLVLPRPGTTVPHESQSIPAPSEASFIATFGALLPPASYLQTPNGKAAYYELPPSSSASFSSSSSISRVLLIHGVQTPAIGLQPLAHDLSTRFPHAHYVLIDLWGHRLSETPLSPHEPALFHHLLSALLDKLRWPSAHLVGYSFGGSTAASFAVAFPEKVASVVLIAPAGLLSSARFSVEERGFLGGGDEGVEKRAQDWILEFLEGGELVVPEGWEERVAQGEVVAEAVRAWQMREHKGHLASVVGVFRDGGVLDRHGVFEEVGRRDLPCFCVLGEKDEVCGVEDLEAVGIRNVAVVEGVGHGVVRERVEEVGGLIGGFWESV